MTRRTSAAGPSWPLLVLLAAAWTAAGCGDRPERWNVVLVTLDTTRADALGCYGAPRPTPSLDRLANEGVRFERAVVTAAVTPVSHAAILTGRNNHEHGLRVMSAAGGYRLPDDVPTIFELLHAKGWRTGAFHSAFPVSDWFGLGRGFDVFESMSGKMIQGNGKANWPIHELQRRSDETTGLVLDFLKDTDEPYALWIHYWDPHDTLILPPDVPPPEPPQPGDDSSRYAGALRELYSQEVRYVDLEIGRLFDALRARGDWDRTIVAVVAGHREGHRDHGWWFHRILYQEQVRVPLLVRVPGARQGAVVGDLVRSTDIAPTVLDYLGLAGLQGSPAGGRSLRPLIEGLEGRAESPRIAFADQINGYDQNAGLIETRPDDVFLYCAMDREWKLVYRPAAPEKSELFHLAADPRELANLFAWSHPEAQRLLRELAREAPWVTAPFTGSGSSAASQGALHGLGYTPGSTVSQEWGWICPEHRSEVRDSPSACPTCGARPVLVARE